MRRNLNTLPKVFGLIREYASLPDVNAYEPEELAIIWLFCTCISYAFGEALPIFEKEYEFLTDGLVDRWHLVPKYLRLAIKFDTVDKPDPLAVDWTYGYCAHVFRQTYKYIDFLEIRYGTKPKSMQGNSPVSYGVPASELDDEVHQLSQGS